jgi:methyl-accepting chemotaxis protein
MATDYGEMVILLGDAMEDHGTAMHGIANEVEDLTASMVRRTERLEEVASSLAKLSKLLGEVIREAETDNATGITLAERVTGIDEKLGSTVNEIHATLATAANPAALSGQEQADLAKEYNGVSTGLLGRSWYHSSRALTHLKALRDTLDGSTGLVAAAKDDTDKTVTHTQEAKEKVGEGAEAAKASAESLKEYGEQV